MRDRISRLFVILSIITFAASCGTPSRQQPGGQDAAPPDVPELPPCDPAADADGDCRTNGAEGCLQTPPLDTEGDGAPDYLDDDVDNDGILDEQEVGPSCDDPRDTDGDGTPDVHDLDSDNDGVNDEYEDRNGDGVIGTCTLQCTTQAHCPEGAHCTLPVDGVGNGVCVDLECSDGETDPHGQDSDGDGVNDGLEGTSICNPTTPMNPFGLKPIRYVDSSISSYPMSNWRLALEIAAVEREPLIANATPLHAAHTFDMTGPKAQVAGFLASRAASAGSAGAEMSVLVLNLEAVPAIASVTVRSSGNAATTFDGFDTVINASLELVTSTPLDVVAVREIVTAAALGRPITDVTFPDPGWVGTADTRFVVAVQSIRRGDELQTLFVGGVARAVSADDPTRTTSFHLNDMSNGTGIALAGNKELLECEQVVISRQAKTDIIFLIDESGSTLDDRERMRDNASLFFSKALAAGLDFRVAVADLNDAREGIFASRQAGGTGDRWLLPTEQAEFEANIIDPSGPDTADAGAEHGLTQMRNAIARHLPRDNADPQKIREDATLVIIIQSDEKAQELIDEGILGGTNVEPTPAEQAQIDTLLAPYLAELVAEDATVHLVAEPLPFGPVCSTGGASHGYGYYELVTATGGLMGSICAVDLGPTIDAIVEDIIGGASPMTLSKVPISASVSVAKSGLPLTRSRQDGFDYRGSTNSITFYNQIFSPAAPSEVVVSYRRWAEQGPLE